MACVSSRKKAPTYCRTERGGGTNRLRCFTGENTGDLVKVKREMSGGNFIEFMRSRFLSKS
jgi:hypothetical protein